MVKQQNWCFYVDSVDTATVELLRHHLAELDSRYCVFATHDGPTGPQLHGYVVMNITVRESHLLQRVPIARWQPSRGTSIASAKSVKTGTDVVETGYCPRLGIYCNVIE